MNSTKLERKLRDSLNRVKKITPGAHRIWELHRIAMEMEGEAIRLEEEKVPGSDPARLRDDAMFIRRLEWDLMELRIAVRGPVQVRGSGRYDDSQWPRGPRP